MTKRLKFETEHLYISSETISEVIENLQGFLNDAPEECRENAYLDVSYGDDYLECTMTYQRLETDEEYNARLSQEKRWEEQRSKADFETYKRLKERFEAKLEDHL